MFGSLERNPNITVNYEAREKKEEEAQKSGHDPIQSLDSIHASQPAS